MVCKSFRQNGNSPQLFTHMALPSINNVCGESLIMLTLENIVVLSQPHPAWDWDQNLRATDFPPFRMVERASLGAQTSHPFTTLSQHTGGLKLGSLGECWRLSTHALCLLVDMLRDTECCPLFFSAVLGLDPSRASGRQRRVEMDLGQSSLGSSGFGTLTSGKLVAFRWCLLLLSKGIVGR